MKMVSAEIQMYRHNAEPQLDSAPSNKTATLCRTRRLCILSDRIAILLIAASWTPRKTKHLITLQFGATCS